MGAIPSAKWLDQSVASGKRQESVNGWRAVEAQHSVSTLRLTENDPDQQEVLERLLEESKPPMPSETSGLHYLLATPFRYPTRLYGSRFRSLSDPGVLYSAAERRTACAEMGYWRWRFVSESDGLHEIAAAPQTLFLAGARGLAVDLRQPPFSGRSAFWTDPADYSNTQALARAARTHAVQLILYESVRDPQRGTCVAVLDPEAFRPKKPTEQETWHLTVTSTGAIWQRERRVFRFDFAQ
jgi:hypothetical protein